MSLFETNQFVSYESIHKEQSCPVCQLFSGHIDMGLKLPCIFQV